MIVSLYFMGALGFWYALQESGERFTWWWIMLALTWPTWVVYSYVLETAGKPVPKPRELVE